MARATFWRQKFGEVWPVIVLLALCLLALAFRVWPASQIVLPESEPVRLLGADAYMQLRHAQFAVDRFPQLQRWDVGTRYPNGLRSTDVGLLDLSVAAASYLLAAGEPVPETVAAATAWSPAILASLTVAAVYWLCRPLVRPLLALAASAIFVLFPGWSLSRTILGFADQHAAAMLLSVLAVAGLVRCLHVSSAPAPPPFWRPSLGHALPMAVFLFTWNGAPAYLFLIGLALLVLATFEILRGLDTAATATATFRYGLGLTIMVVVPSLLWQDLVMVPQTFPLVVGACGLLTMGPAAYLYGAKRLVRRGVSPRAVAWSGLVVVVASGYSIMVYSDGAAALASDLLDPKVLLLEGQLQMSWSAYWRSLGLAGMLALAAPPLVLNAALGRPESRTALVPATVAAMVMLLSWQTNAYAYQAPPFVAMLATLALVELAVLTRPSASPRYGSAFARAMLLALVVPTWPLGLVDPPVLSSEYAGRLQSLDDGWLQTMAWLKDHTPEPSVPASAAVEPWDGDGYEFPPDTHGVLSAGEFGSFVSALADRPVVWSGGATRRTAEWLMCEEESESLDLLCPACGPEEAVDYIVLDALTIGSRFFDKARTIGRSAQEYLVVDRHWEVPPGRIPNLTLSETARRTMALRLYLEDGAELSHYRLVYESPHQSYLAHRVGPTGIQRLTLPVNSVEDERKYRRRLERGGLVVTTEGTVYDHEITASVKIFEQVLGARLIGHAAPRTVVKATLRLQAASTKRTFEYVRTVTADDEGNFMVVVPYATTGATRAGAVLPLEEGYQIRVGTPGMAPEAVLQLTVTEAQVRQGHAVRMRGIH